MTLSCTRTKPMTDASKPLKDSIEEYEFYCDMCDGTHECVEDCMCDSCCLSKGEAYADSYNDTYD